MSTPNLTWNYRPQTSHSILRSRIRDFARTIFKGVAGTTIDGSQAIVTFFADRTAIYFNLVSERHVTVNVAPSRVSDAGRLCGALVGSKLMETIHERESQVRKVERTWRATSPTWSPTPSFAGTPPTSATRPTIWPRRPD